VALWALGVVRASVRARTGGYGSGSSLTIPLKTRATFNNDEIFHMLYHAADEPAILQEAEKRQHRIEDADYRKDEVDPFVQE
jgi:hypothetical protein